MFQFTYFFPSGISQNLHLSTSFLCLVTISISVPNHVSGGVNRSLKRGADSSVMWVIETERWTLVPLLCVCVRWGMQPYSGIARQRQNRGRGRFQDVGQSYTSGDTIQYNGIFCIACVALTHGLSHLSVSVWAHNVCGNYMLILTAMVGGRWALWPAVLFAVGSGEVGLGWASAKTHLTTPCGHLGHSLFGLQSLRPSKSKKILIACGQSSWLKSRFL